MEYLDFFRSRLVGKIGALPAGELRRSRVPSGWTPAELLNHCAHVELRWLEWRFEGRDVDEPWGDDRDGRWHVAAGESFEGLAAGLRAQAALDIYTSLGVPEAAQSIPAAGPAS